MHRRSAGLVAVLICLLIGSTAYADTIYLPLTSSGGAAGTATATSTPVGTTPIVSSTPTPTLNPGVPLRNGDFEQGRIAWIETSSDRRALIRSDGLRVFPRSGKYVAALGGVNAETSSISQQIVIPANATTLTYAYQVKSTDVSFNDFGEVNINGKLIKELALSNEEATTTWQGQTVDIKAYAGQTVTLTFLATTDTSEPAEWYLDDVRVD